MKIGQYSSGETWGDVNPAALDKGLGGREGAVIHLAQAWADRGHQVTVFANNQKSTHLKGKNGGSVSYVDIDLAVPMLSAFQYDAFVSWEVPEVFGIPGIDVKVKLCGMQVAHMGAGDDEEITRLPDAWVALSPWHANFLQKQTEFMNRIEVQPNGVDITRFPERVGRSAELRAAEAPFHFVYASSPDRGLHHLLRMWSRLREEFPGCLLHVAYGIEHYVNNVRWSHNVQGEMAVDIEKGIRQDGIVYHGKIGQTELAAIHSMADALLYPADTLSPTETGCITVIEAAAGGAVVVTTDADCLQSEFESFATIVPLPFDEDDYIRAIHESLEDKKRRTKMQVQGRRFAESRDWKKIADQWIKMIDRIRLEKETGKVRMSLDTGKPYSTSQQLEDERANDRWEQPV